MAFLMVVILGFGDLVGLGFVVVRDGSIWDSSTSGIEIKCLYWKFWQWRSWFEVAIPHSWELHIPPLPKGVVIILGSPMSRITGNQRMGTETRSRSFDPKPFRLNHLADIFFAPGRTQISSKIRHFPRCPSYPQITNHNFFRQQKQAREVQEISRAARVSFSFFIFPLKLRNMFLPLGNKKSTLSPGRPCESFVSQGSIDSFF